MPINPAGKSNPTIFGPAHRSARAEDAANAPPTSPVSLAPLPPAASQASAHPASDQGGGIKPNLRAAATKTLAEQEPQATKKQRRAEAPKHTAKQSIESKAINAGCVTPDGKPDISGYYRRQRERCAINAGFVTPDGQPDVTGYNRRTRDRVALNAGCVTNDGEPDVNKYNLGNKERAALRAGLLTPDGQPDVNAYNRRLTKLAALNAGFVTDAGQSDASAYYRHTREERARKAGFLTADGEPDVTAHMQHFHKRTALNAGCVTADGQPDVTAYNRRTAKLAALKAGCVAADGQPDVTAYNRHTREERARKAGFLTADGEPDVPAHIQHFQKRAALNAGCVTADGQPDVNAYNRHTREEKARKAGFLTADGQADVTAHIQHFHKRTALNAGCVTADGQPDVNAYNRGTEKLAALNAACVTADGQPNAAAYRRHIRKEKARKAGFLTADGEPDVKAYSQHINKRTALNAGFVDADGQPDVTAYNRHTREKRIQKAPGPKRQKGKAVKEELAFPASVFPAPTAGVEAARINTAQLSHVPTTSYAMIDLTAGEGSAMTVFTVRHTDEAIVSTGKQTYDAALDKVFPIRAPAHPDQVHPDYADPHDPSRCAPQVALEGIRFYTGGDSPNELTLWRRARNNFDGDQPHENKKLFIEALKRSCQEELRATMEGRPPPSSQRVRVDVIKDASQCDSPEEFAALRNQYGGFLTDYAPPSQPSLRNARIVCLFAGSRLASAEESRHYLDQLGAEFGWKALQDYAANAQHYGKHGEIAWAPYGGGNMGQYFNSTFKPGPEGTLQVDADKTNAFLCPVIVELKDRHGKPRKESMLMVVQDRLIDMGKQIKLSYGESYTLDAKESTPRMPSHPVKQEIPEKHDDTGIPTTAAGEIDLWEPPRLWDHIV